VVEDFVGWSWSMNLPLRFVDVFAPAVIEYYCDVGCRALSVTARAHRRAVLRRIAGYGRALRPPSAPQKASLAGAPYDAGEFIALISWARSFVTATSRRDAHSLLALGFGAGLSASEIIALRHSDVLSRASGADIIVRGPSARVVPVLRAYQALLPASNGDRNLFAFRAARHGEYVNAITNFTRRVPGPRPVVQRMRATWIVHHLEASTPLDVLLDAAGLATPAALTRFLPFVRQRPVEERLRLLRFAVAPDGDDQGF
jgi:integrase